MAMKRAKVVFTCGISLLALCAVAAVFGTTNTIGQQGKVARVDWMSKLPDNTEISQLNIPGTHDTLALYGLADFSGQCQSLDVKQQLRIGVRFLDVRLKQIGNKLRAVHGFVDQKESFDFVVKELESFLKENPKETLFISVKEDDKAESPAFSFEECLNTYLNDEFWYTSDTMPQTLGQVRGKMVLLTRYDDGNKGVNMADKWQDCGSFSLDDFYIQDEYIIDDIEAKKAAILACSEKDSTYRLNFFSGYFRKGFPPSNAPSVAKIINPWAIKTLPQMNKRGVCLFDFITSELMDAYFGGQA